MIQEAETSISNIRRHLDFPEAKLLIRIHETLSGSPYTTWIKNKPWISLNFTLLTKMLYRAYHDSFPTAYYDTVAKSLKLLLDDDLIKMKDEYGNMITNPNPSDYYSNRRYLFTINYNNTMTCGIDATIPMPKPEDNTRKNVIAFKTKKDFKEEEMRAKVEGKLPFMKEPVLAINTKLAKIFGVLESAIICKLHEFYQKGTPFELNDGKKCFLMMPYEWSYELCHLWSDFEIRVAMMKLDDICVIDLRHIGPNVYGYSLDYYNIFLHIQDQDLDPPPNILGLPPLRFDCPIEKEETK